MKIRVLLKQVFSAHGLNPNNVSNICIERGSATISTTADGRPLAPRIDLMQIPGPRTAAESKSASVTAAQSSPVKDASKSTARSNNPI